MILCCFVGKVGPCGRGTKNDAALAITVARSAIHFLPNRTSCFLSLHMYGLIPQLNGGEQIRPQWGTLTRLHSVRAGHASSRFFGGFPVSWLPFYFSVFIFALSDFSLSLNRPCDLRCLKKMSPIKRKPRLSQWVQQPYCRNCCKTLTSSIMSFSRQDVYASV